MLRRVGDGNITFWSVMPYSKIRHGHQKVFTDGIEDGFQEKNIVMRGVSNEKSLTCFNKLPDIMIRSHIGRGSGINIIKGGAFIGSGECMSTKNMLLLANPEKKIVLIIKDHDITGMIYEMMTFFFEALSTEKIFNLNEHLEKLLHKT